MKIPASRPSWLGHAVVLVVMIASIAATRAIWITPREKERLSLQEEETKLRAELADLQSGIQEIDVWRRDHPGADVAGRVKRARPAGTMVAAALEALAAAAKRNGLRTEWIQPAGTPVDEVVTDASGATATFRKVELRLRLEAPYRAVGEYLAEVEGLDQLIVVRGTSLRFEASTAPNLIADVTFWVYGTP